MSEGNTATPCIFLVDDEDDLRRAFRRLLGAEGFDVRAFASAQEFLDTLQGDEFGCVLMDISMPGLDGLAAQRRLVCRHPGLPVVFVTANSDLVRAQATDLGGAVSCLIKPVRRAELLRTVRTALEVAQVRLARTRADAALRRGLDSLSAREREMLACLAQGHLTSTLAVTLGCSEEEISRLRAELMSRLGHCSLAELARTLGSRGATPAAGAQGQAASTP